MSDHEQSYYEIALTNRQVVVAFVILLVCLMGSFVAGVWIGRGDAVDAGGEAVERAGVDDSEARPLDFFSGGELDEEAGDGAARTPPPAERPAAGPPAEDPADARARREAERRRAAEEAAGGQDVAGGEGAALGPQAPPAGPPAGTGGGREATAGGPVVQVFSSSDRAQAEKVVGRLTGGGERAFLSPVEVGGQTMYRVRIGPFGDRGEAEEVAERVRRQYRYETWITQ